eukprot:TRINITY_DN298_c0_g1_i1.p1 TRINITY_DN298_c0_g1~~TRINITY_DN298_c0_g1_i1.p1  ORF type:complete len:923 (-),score=142.73 TRINITY_DN298_c0_g1_i1:72-2483(-)
MHVKVLGYQPTYESDLMLRRRLRMNRKIVFVFLVLTTTYHLMALDYQYVHKGWLAKYHGGHQIVYSFRYIEWVCCAPIVLSISGQLDHAEDGSARNGIIPSSLLTGIYCIISWQGLVVEDLWAAWILIAMAFFSYFVASVEQLAFVWYLKDQGREGVLRACLLFYLVVMIGIYGVVYLLPIPGWISATLENKFYCIFDISFKFGTSLMIMATNDQKNSVDLKKESEVIADDFNYLIDNASVPVIGVDREGHVDLWNQKAAELTGLPTARARGLCIQDLVPSSRRKDLARMVRKTLADEDGGTLEISLTCEAAEELADLHHMLKSTRLVLSAARRSDKLGHLIGVTFIGCDLTEIAAYREAETRKTRFLGVVSHELRSPLHGIIGLVTTLADAEQDKMRAKRLNMILNCANRLLDLVVNIMEMASLQTQRQSGRTKMILHRDPVELPKIIEEVVMLVRSSVDKRGKALVHPGIELVNNLSTMPIIEADAHKCTQVFFNLITNACKFTHSGCVTVCSNTCSDDEWVEVSVTDTGTGIHAEALERIFQAFEQEDSSEARCQEGIGLGLSIAKEVVEMHGGNISVQSEVGVGSTFTVRLPVTMIDIAKETAKSTTSGVVANATAKLSTSGPAMMPRSRTVDSRTSQQTDKHLILSVDDDECNQMLIHDLLQEDFEIHKAMDGHEALAYMENSENPIPAIMLLDVMMPGITGIEVCRKLREDLGFSPITLPIFMVSASTVESTMRQAFEAGCNDYIAKPMRKMELKARIAAALKRKDSLPDTSETSNDNTTALSADLRQRKNRTRSPE